MPNHRTSDRDAAVPIHWMLAAIVVGLLLVQLPVQIGFWQQIEPGHPVLWSVTLMAIVLTVAAVYGFIRRQAWAVWPALCATTWTATILFESWALGTSRWALVGITVVTAAFLLLVMLPVPKLDKPTIGVRVFYAAVVSLTSYVAFWGLVFPTGTGWNLSFMADSFDGSLPFNIAVPTLHARVIGSLYLAATVVCVLNMFSRSWSQAQIGTWMILLWTGSIMGITLTHMEFFDWAKPSVWFWFVAYIGFPVIAAWILKRRIQNDKSPSKSPLLNAAKTYFAVQGVTFIALACILQFSPTAAAAIWPWAIIPLLSRFYSAPLVTFGISSLVSSRCVSSCDVRSLSSALAVMACALIIASCLHHDKFSFAGPAAWVWFGSLLVIGVANLSIAVTSFGLAQSKVKSES